MSVELVFNELSLEPLASDVREARQRMETLIQVIVALRQLGTSRSLRAVFDFRDFQLAESYWLAQWLNDPAVDRERRRYWLTIVLKAPVLRESDPADVRTRESEEEFLFRDQPSPGLGGAWLLGGIALSFTSSEDWAHRVVELTHRWLDENAELVENTIEVLHASTTQHVEQHKSWLRTEARLGVRDGEDLWRRRSELFPSLEFCDSVADQLRVLRSRELHLSSVTKRLFELEAYFRSWDSGPFDPSAIPARLSPESQTTLDRYGKERTFLCPDGVECPAASSSGPRSVSSPGIHA